MNFLNVGINNWKSQAGEVTTKPIFHHCSPHSQLSALGISPQYAIDAPLFIVCIPPPASLPPLQHLGLIHEKKRIISMNFHQVADDFYRMLSPDALILRFHSGWVKKFGVRFHKMETGEGADLALRNRWFCLGGCVVNIL